MNEFTFQHFKTMFPFATEKTLPGARQLHWVDGDRENSITIFDDAEGERQARAMSFGMNDVQWIGGVRFSSTI